MKQSIILLGILYVYVSLANGSKILKVCLAPSKSHHILCQGVVDTLADSGHEVTFINSFATNSKKYKEITISELSTSLEKYHLGFKANEANKLTMLTVIPHWQQDVSKIFFNHPKIVDFFNDKNQKFDLVIIEYFMNEMLIGLGVRYKCPVALLSSLSIMQWLATMTSNPLSVETVPNMFTPFTTNMSLKQRVINMFAAVGGEIMGKFFLEPTSKKLYNEYMSEEAKLVPFEDLNKQISMVFANSHPSVGLPRPLLPNTIEIGGYHIADPEPLPKDLQEVIDSAKHGVIFFSMGSNLKSKDMNIELRQSILKVLSTFKQTILWKFEEDLPNKPKNVIIRKWMPQSSILAHKNVKLFISHGGLLSLTEATYFGVPLLAIPIFGDQFHNAMTLSEKGQGVMLSFENITEASLMWSINEAINNPKYSEIAKMNQKIFHDRPMKPRELLSFYVDHIIRTKGAKYLSPPPLSRTSQLLLDVAAVILIPLVLITLLFSLICRKLCSISRKTQIDERKKKN